MTERERAPFVSLQDFVDRAGLRKDERQVLAEVGALNAFGLTRRSALWQVERAGRPRGPLFRDAVEDEPAESPLPEMDLAERLQADLLGASVTVGPHPMALYRPTLDRRGIRRASELSRLPDGERVSVAGAVICRQRPGTAKGFLFLTLEDETGLTNVTVRPDLFERAHGVLMGHTVLEIDGVLQNEEGTSVRAVEVRALGAAGSEARQAADAAAAEAERITPAGAADAAHTPGGSGRATVAGDAPTANPAAISYSRDFCR